MSSGNISANATLVKHECHAFGLIDTAEEVNGKCVIEKIKGRITIPC